MKTYARVVSGIVMEIIEPMTDNAGNEIPIANRFTSEFVATLVDVTSVSPAPTCWWTYDGSKFHPPGP
jgi:hypothetical protein